MAKRLSAKEIKHDIREDEVRTFLAGVFLTLEENPKIVLASLAGILLLAVAGSGAYAFLDNRRQAAVSELVEAMKTYEAPIDEQAATPDDPDEPSFGSEEERRARAKEAFEEVQGSVGSNVAGDVAGLYLADIALAEGDRETARAIWEDFLDDHEDHVLALSVRLNLIRLDRDNGKAAEVAQGLEEELASARGVLPHDVILYELAQTREALGETAAAVDLYQRIVDEYPQSPYVAKARQMTTSTGS